MTLLVLICFNLFSVRTRLKLLWVYLRGNEIALLIPARWIMFYVLYVFVLCDAKRRFNCIKVSVCLINREFWCIFHIER